MNETTINEPTSVGRAGPPERLLLTVVEAASALAVGRTTLCGLINTGALGVVHIGRAVRIPVTELQRYVTQVTK